MEISWQKLEFIKAHSQLDGQRIFVEGLIKGLAQAQSGPIEINTLVAGLEDALREINDTLKIAGALL